MKKEKIIHFLIVYVPSFLLDVFIIYMLWNAWIPNITGFSSITIWQAFGIKVISLALSDKFNLFKNE